MLPRKWTLFPFGVTYIHTYVHTNLYMCMCVCVICESFGIKTPLVSDLAVHFFFFIQCWILDFTNRLLQTDFFFIRLENTHVCLYSLYTLFNDMIFQDCYKISVNIYILVIVIESCDTELIVNKARLRLTEFNTNGEREKQDKLDRHIYKQENRKSYQIASFSWQLTFCTVMKVIV